jgi:hypothetical protein
MSDKEVIEKLKAEIIRMSALNSGAEYEELEEKKIASYEIRLSTFNNFNKYIKTLKTKRKNVKKGEIMDNIITKFLADNESVLDKLL